MAHIVFKKPFAGRKKGDEWLDCPSTLSRRLVNREVAEIKSDNKATAQKPKATKKDE